MHHEPNKVGTAVYVDHQTAISALATTAGSHTLDVTVFDIAFIRCFYPPKQTMNAGQDLDCNRLNYVQVPTTR